MLRLLKVSGESLSPVVQDGDFVLIAKIPLLIKSLHRGDVIAFHHKIYGTMIKQVDDISIDGERFIVTGNHENSVDSNQFGAKCGFVYMVNVVGIIIRKKTNDEWENY